MIDEAKADEQGVDLVERLFVVFMNEVRGLRVDDDTTKMGIRAILRELDTMRGAANATCQDAPPKFGPTRPPPPVPPGAVAEPPTKPADHVWKCGSCSRVLKNGTSGHALDCPYRVYE